MTESYTHVSNDKELKQAIFFRQLELYYQALPHSIIAIVINSSILLWLLWEGVDQSRLLAWYAVIFILVFYRLLNLINYRRASQQQKSSPHWYYHMLAGSILSGLTWGVAGYLLFSADSIYYQVLLAFIIAGMSTGAIINLSSFIESSLSFLLLILAPFMIRLFQDGSIEAIKMGIMVCLFMVLLAAAARRVHRIVIDGLRMKLLYGKAEVKIKQQAFYDELTGLPNRRLLGDRLLRALSRAERSDLKGALLFLDLDHFKRINDSLGHVVGDVLLAEVAKRLQSIIRIEDSAARLGGDEFVVLLTDLEGGADVIAQNVQATADKIRLALAEPYHIKGHELHVTVSIGIALYPSDSKDSGDLLKHADTAMYRAKEQGRNSIQFFLQHMQESLTERLKLERALRKAIDKDEFELYVQPLVNSEYRIYGGEVLLRWFKDGNESISPAEFIPVAEETGLIYMIGDWVFDQTCVYLQEITTKHQDLDLEYLSVNISPREFRQKNFANRVESILSQCDINPGMLEIEVTENVLVEDINDTVNKMERLRRLGVSFSIDDFGTGYSSMAYLKQLPVDTLKIDRSFVQDVLTDSNDATIVKTITSMAGMLGLNVIAEGVEDEETLAFLKQSQCKSFQGYLFGRPVPFDEFIQQVKSQDLLRANS